MAILWPEIFRTDHEIAFAHTSFKWANLASHNAGVTVVIVGISKEKAKAKSLYSIDSDGHTSKRLVDNINGYLVAAPNVEVIGRSSTPDERTTMQFGNHTYYGVDLLLTRGEAVHLVEEHPQAIQFIRPFLGSREVINGVPRACVWVHEKDREDAEVIPPFKTIFSKVQQARKKKTSDKSAQALSETPYRFREQFESERITTVVPAISSENRDYMPVGISTPKSVVGHKCYALYDAPLWNLALIASRLHWVWIGTVCARMRTDFSYSNTLGWNTFPIPSLTEKNKADLTRCAEDILLAREVHFPKTIADLYDPEEMADDLRAAHDRNDEVLERIYIGRRFKNDTERLEKLFELYTRMSNKNDLKKTNSRMKA